ncbi:lysophospholipase L1-like esterase [Pseudarthrobacter oxydans]|uniref:SGNH/GDSL hydrolase family protein n=1 Tax=Pseudarthrobacter oxydans TaxID=1671 RepID=UPI0027884B57|nr:SGNH/GDSL hydrolase family protein [Pseudarthrobacter oxydans]MDP9982369.1 lysophospholipase L1-like esterase [Pseudarthrobacter oxydans]
MGTLKLRRRRTALGAGLATLAMAAGLAAVPAQAVDKTTYVALGDSYAAGQGAGPYLDNCYRSDNTYSELAADTKAVKLVKNAACSGKTTQDVVSSQLGRLNRSTELVTITAGGNNLGFGAIVTACGAAMVNPTEAAAAACDKASADAAVMIGSGQLAAEVASMIRSVKAAAPNAEIVVTGYPYLYDPVPLNTDDPMSVFIAQATQLADGLNGSIAGAALANGAEYVDVRAAFAGHGINSKTNQPWINLDYANLGSADNFHPNAAGYKAYYASMSAAGAFSVR